MTQNDYALAQHSLCCQQLGISDRHDEPGPTLLEVVTKISNERTAIEEVATEADYLRDTMAKMEYNYRYEREKMARVIRRLVRYADRVADRHPKAVTICGQNARVEGGIWLAEFDRQNDKILPPAEGGSTEAAKP